MTRMKGMRYIATLIVGPCLSRTEAEELLGFLHPGGKLVRLEGPLAIYRVPTGEKEEAIRDLNRPLVFHGLPYIVVTHKTSGTIRKAMEAGRRGLYAKKRLFILHFLHLVGRLKGLPRKGWVIRGVEDPESVSEHSHRVSVLAFLLFGWEGAVSAMLHDLQEALTGDLLPWEEGKGQKERDAAWRLFCMLEHLYPELRTYWELQTTFRDADLLELQLQAVEYEATRCLDPAEFLADEMSTPEGRRLKEELLEYRKLLNMLYKCKKS